MDWLNSCKDSNTRLSGVIESSEGKGEKVVEKR